MKTSDLMIEAKKLIDTSEKWTQGNFATDKYGMEVSYASEKATCFCSLGALRSVAYKEWRSTCELKELDEAKSFINTAIDNTSPNIWGIAGFNDTSTHEEVMDVWDDAIKLAQKQEA